MTESIKKADSLPPRLCSEIKLFDLCDLEVCKHKSGRFCSDSGLLGRFEKITDNEVRVSERYNSEGIDDAEEDGVDSDGYNDEEDEFVRDGSDDSEDNDWEDKE